VRVKSKYKNSMTCVNGENISFDHKGIADVVEPIAMRLSCRPGYELLDPPPPVTIVTIDGKRYYKYKDEFYPEYLNQGNAMSYIKDKALEYCKGRGIDIGSSEWPIDGADAIQEGGKEDAYNLPSYEDGSLDFVFSSHCLEHLDKYKDALKLWIQKLKRGGILFLYLPHKDMKLWNPGGLWVGEGHKWIPTHEALTEDFKRLGLKIIDVNKDKDTYWSFHIVGQKPGGKQVKKKEIEDTEVEVDPWNRVSDFPQ